MTNQFSGNPDPIQDSFDTGPLSWVIGEIRDSLARSKAAIFEGVSADDEGKSTLLAHAKSYLHQAHGALQIVDVDGVAIITETVEDLMERIKNGQLPFSQENAEAIERGYAAVVEYLEELMAGAQPQPVRLFPYYRTLLEVRGAERIHPADLFFPNLAIRPHLPANPALPKKPDYTQLRLRFEKSLLPFLKSGEKDKSVPLLEIIASVEKAQENSQSQAFWWVMHGFAETVRDGQVPSELFVKQLFGRINLQIRRLAEGSTSISERLLRDALFFIARAQEPGPRARQIRQVYQLDGLIPKDYERPRYGQIDVAALAVAKDKLNQAKTIWGRIADDDANQWPLFEQEMQALAEASSKLNAPALSKLLRELTGIARHAATGQMNRALGLEIATNLLFVENSLEHITRLPDDFSTRADALSARLLALLAGETPTDSAQWMDDLSRAAQQRQTVLALATEMKANLRNVEKILDEYFLDPGKRDSLGQIDPALHQIAGALGLLDQSDASAAVEHTQAAVRRFADPEYTAGDPASERQAMADVAQNLGALGFFIEMLPQNFEGAKHRFTFHRDSGLFRANPVERTAAAAIHVDVAPLEGEEVAASVPTVAVEETPVLTVEQELLLHQQQSQELAASVAAHPEDLALQEQLKESLQQVRKDAALLDNPEAKERAQAAIAMLENHDIAASQQAIAGMLSPQETPAPTPAPTAAPAPATDDAVDAELLEIFMMEADEVLAFVQENVPQSRRNPQNQDLLTTIRRSFHTLKGSGRMVGLQVFSEAAASIEQVMNMWLADARAGNDDLYALLDFAAAELFAWVEEIKEKGQSGRTSRQIVNAANRIKAGGKFELDAEPEPVPETPAPVLETPAPVMETPVLETPAPVLEMPVAVSETPAPVLAAEEPESEALNLEIPDVAESVAEADLAIAPVSELSFENIPAPQEAEVLSSLEMPPLELGSSTDADAVSSIELSLEQDAAPLADLSVPEPAEVAQSVDAVSDLPLDLQPDLQPDLMADLQIPALDVQEQQAAPEAVLEATPVVEAEPEVEAVPAAPAVPDAEQLLQELAALEAETASLDLPELPGLDLGESALELSPEAAPEMAAEPAPELVLETAPEAAPDAVPDAATGFALEEADLLADGVADEAAHEPAPEPTEATDATDEAAVAAMPEIVAETVVDSGAESAADMLADSVSEAVPGLLPATELGTAADSLDLGIESLADATAIEASPAEEQDSAADSAALDVPELDISTPTALEDQLLRELAELSAEHEEGMAEAAADAAAETLEAAAVAELAEVVEIAEPEPGVPEATPIPQQPEVSLAPVRDENIRQIGTLEVSTPLFNIYLAETESIVRSLEGEMAAWRQDRQRAVAKIAVHSVHSLAGSSATVGFHSLQGLAHALEMVLESLRRRPVLLEDAEYDFLDQAVATIKQMLASFAQGELPPAQTELVQQLQDWQLICAERPGLIVPTPSPGYHSLLDELEAHLLNDEDLARLEKLAAEEGISDDSQLDDLLAPAAPEALPTEAAAEDSAAMPELEALLPLEPEAEAEGVQAADSEPEPEMMLEPVADELALPDVAALSDELAELSALAAQDEVVEAAPLPDSLPDAVSAEERFSADGPTIAELYHAVVPQGGPEDGLPAPLLPEAVAEPETGFETEPEPEDLEASIEAELAALAQAQREDAIAAPVAAPVAAQDLLPEAAPQVEDLPLAAPLAEVAPLVETAPAIEAPAVPQAVPAPVREESMVLETATLINDELDADLLPVFIEEGRDLLPKVGEALRAWQQNPADNQYPKSLLRLLHTVKGSARMAGAMRLGQHAHEIETRIETLMHLGPISQQSSEDLLAHYDHSVYLFDVLQNPELAQQPAPQLPGAPVLQVADGVVEQAAAPAADAAAPARVVPPLVAKTALVSAPVPLVRVRADILDRLVNQAGEVSIARSKLENEVGLLRQSLSELTENIGRLRAQLREVEIQAESQITSRMAHQADREFDPLEFDRFTRLQELTRMMAESVNDVASVQEGLGRTVESATLDLAVQARLTRDLQQDLMRVRMVPFSSVSERLFRVTRQAAKDTDKRVNLDIRGAAVEMDRSVLEKMAGPFEHLLRNAVAHGIESRAARRASEKSEIGEIMVEIRQEGNEVVISFRDDGAGLNLERIRAKGREAGLIAADAEISDLEAMNLIFEPGFSTQAELTELAGRGVGMDVVRSEAASLGGRVEVRSETGKGAQFTIHLPLTLAVTQVVLVTTGGNTYAVPSVLVEQVQQVKEAPLAQAYADGYVTWQGQHVPMHYLSALLGDSRAVPVGQRYTPVMILKSGHERVAVHVDEVVGNREVVVKNIGPQLARMPGIAGATVLGSGDIVLILNPVPLAQRFASQQERRLMEVPDSPAAEVAVPEAGAPVADATAIPGNESALLAEPAPVSAPAAPQVQEEGLQHQSLRKLPIVMVVDDSLTVRKVTQRFLVREGYQVVLAKDGVDALEQLQTITPDVMLVDIEMPRMDGFDLTRNVRNDERTANTPIIMITSRTADKHRNYALELGVNAYFGKPFQEDKLLEAISGFTK